jgi:hypothetical protein
MDRPSIRWVISNGVIRAFTAVAVAIAAATVVGLVVLHVH